MDIILYNPISRNGKNSKLVLRLAKRLKRKGRNVEIKSLLEILDIQRYLNSVKDTARFIIVGGDGTLNHLANSIKDFNIKQEIYLYRAGTGNDFARSIKAKRKLIPIKNYLYNLPYVEFKDEKISFLNGVGLGLDGEIVHLVNINSNSKKKSNYLLEALKTFKTFKPLPSKLVVDGNNIFIDKTWIVSIMNAQYFGGGMKIAPFADRLDKHVDVVIVKNVSRFKLFLIFPLIYLGLHRLFKNYVEILKAKEVELEFSDPMYMQIDGESFDDISKITVKNENF